MAFSIPRLLMPSLLWLLLTSTSAWAQQQELTASDGANSDFFGYSVAISGDYAVAGAYQKIVGTNGLQGAVYVFVRSGSTWGQQQRLTAADGAAGDGFGFSTGISGDYVVAGAYNKTVSANAAQGAAYVFLRTGTTWAQQQRLMPADGAASDVFGGSVAISGDYAIVGADNKDIGTNAHQGAAYVFLRTGITWAQQQRLTAMAGPSSDAAANDRFGASVAISGDYALVGANLKTISGNSAQGRAYLFNRTGTAWAVSTNPFGALDGTANDQFGSSVSLSGDYAIVGAPNKNIGSNNGQGAAYLYYRTGGTNWSFVRRITDNAPANTSNGVAVGLANGTFIIGGRAYQNGRGKIAFGTVD